MKQRFAAPAEARNWEVMYDSHHTTLGCKPRNSVHGCMIASLPPGLPWAPSLSLATFAL